MENFKKLIKKPLLIASCCILALFSLGLIIMSCQSKASAPYKYDISFTSIEIELDDNVATLTIGAFGYEETETTEYYIRDGKLFIKNISTHEYTQLGSIDAYKIKMQMPVDSSDPSAGYMTITCKCDLTNTIRTINIVMMVIGALGIATSLIYTTYEKKQSGKSQNIQDNNNITE